MAQSAQIAKVRYNHNAMIDWMIANPACSLGAMAIEFEVTQSWISTVVNSDIFKAKLAERQDLHFDNISSSLTEKLTGVAHVGVEKVGELLEDCEDLRAASDATDKLLSRMGYGAPHGGARGREAQAPVYNTVIQVSEGITKADLARARQRLETQAPTAQEDPPEIEAQEDPLEAPEALEPQSISDAKAASGSGDVSGDANAEEGDSLDLLKDKEEEEALPALPALPNLGPLT